MSFAFLDDVYKDEDDKEDYGLIVNNILNVNNDEPGLKKENFTRYTPVDDNSNELNYSNIENMSKYIEKKYNEKKEGKKENKKIKKKENFKNEIEECEEFIKHLSKCSRCRQLLIKKLNLNRNPEDIKREQYLDLVIFTLSGVFVLFLLDMVLNFGKNLNKK